MVEQYFNSRMWHLVVMAITSSFSSVSVTQGCNFNLCCYFLFFLNTTPRPWGAGFLAVTRICLTAHISFILSLLSQYIYNYITDWKACACFFKPWLKFHFGDSEPAHDRQQWLWLDHMCVSTVYCSQCSPHPLSKRSMLSKSHLLELT